jgi:hypothetical protein
VFTARYALSSYIKQIRFLFKGLILIFLFQLWMPFLSHMIPYHLCEFLRCLWEGSLNHMKNQLRTNLTNLNCLRLARWYNFSTNRNNLGCFVLLFFAADVKSETNDSHNWEENHCWRCSVISRSWRIPLLVSHVVCCWYILCASFSTRPHPIRLHFIPLCSFKLIFSALFVYFYLYFQRQWIQKISVIYS